MPWGAAVSAVGSVAGGLISSSGSSKASSAQVQSARIAATTEQNMYNQIRQDLSPWTSTGGNALTQLAGGLGLSSAGFAGQGQLNLPMLLGLAPTSTDLTSILQSTPGYKWTVDQGTAAINNTAAARGGLDSGNTLKALQSYGQGQASTTWQNYLNNVTNYLGQLSGVSSSGQNAAALTGSAGTSAANSIANQLNNAGTASASGSVGSSNAWNSSLGQITNALGQASSGSNNPFSGLVTSGYNALTSLGTYGNTGSAGDVGTNFLQNTGFYTPLVSS